MCIRDRYGAAHGRGHAPPPCGLRACGNGAEPGPASYTHLDVYKRQEPGPLNAGINETGVKARCV